MSTRTLQFKQVDGYSETPPEWQQTKDKPAIKLRSLVSLSKALGHPPTVEALDWQEASDVLVELAIAKIEQKDCRTCVQYRQTAILPFKCLLHIRDLKSERCTNHDKHKLDTSFEQLTGRKG